VHDLARELVGGLSVNHGGRRLSGYAAAVDKQALLDELCSELEAELTRSTKRAQEAADAATHDENKPEGDKDMRSTEASYIARGQAERVRDLEQSLVKLGAMKLKDFADGESIQASALVDVELEGKGKTTYFVVAAGGGVKLKGNILSLTTTSPLGMALLGCSAGDEAEVVTAQGTKTYAVVRVR
jgi:transcription elongation GreA/GreB family factor